MANEAKWQLAQCLIDAKKTVDSMLYIAENGEQLSNIGLRDKTRELRRTFYINCGNLLDKSFPKKKKEILSDDVVKQVYYERDKYYAHKDSNYQRKEYNSLSEIAEEMKMQLSHLREFCKSELPEVVTLDFVPFDSQLFRLLNRVTKDIENKIWDRQHPLGKTPIPPGTATKVLPLFNDMDDLQSIPDDKRKEYAVLFKTGICMEETIQKLQDSCIRINALHGENIWVSLSKDGFEKIKKLREIGLMNQFDIPYSPQTPEELARCMKKLKDIGF